MLIELACPRHVKVVKYKDSKWPTGKAIAIMVETAPDEAQLWTVVFDDSGMVWEIPCQGIRFTNNISLGRFIKPEGSIPCPCMNLHVIVVDMRITKSVGWRIQISLSAPNAER